MKRLHEPISVSTDKGYPVRIHRSDQTHRVTGVVDLWVSQGRWWGQEERRVYFRITTTAAALQLYRSEGGWVLTRILD